MKRPRSTLTVHPRGEGDPDEKRAEARHREQRQRLAELRREGARHAHLCARRRRTHVHVQVPLVEEAIALRDEVPALQVPHRGALVLRLGGSHLVLATVQRGPLRLVEVRPCVDRYLQLQTSCS